MTKRNRRTPEQIIQDLNAKLSKARAKVAIAESKGDPRLAPIVDSLAALTANEAVVRKGLTTGPQSFANRKRSHELWLLEIQAAENLAVVALDEIQSQKAYLKRALATFGERLAANPDDPKIAEDVQATLATGFPTDPNVDTYRDALSQAQNARKEFTQEKMAQQGNAAQAQG